MKQRPVTESSFSQASDAASSRPVTGLAVCGWRSHPERLGEWLAPDPPGGRIFGRQDIGDSPRLPLLRWRPSAATAALPVQSTRISAAQLEVVARGRCLHLRRLGKRGLVVGGQAVEEALVEPGDLVELSGEMLLLVVERPVPGGGPVEEHSFGMADADGIIGESAACWALRSAIRFAAAREGHCLVLGESGTGKELVSRALHRRSRRAGGPFVSRNAATLPDSLLDAELYGNAAGYPNAGMPERSGLVGAAHRGTLFLDEVAELPVAAQTHLLRLLDEGEYHRLGEARPRRADLRLVGATNRPLTQLRADVAARFSQRVQLPPLGERREDIPLLAAGLLRAQAESDPWLARFFPHGIHGWPRISLGLLRQLLTRDYTTHSRELAGLLWRSAEASQGDELEPLSDDEAPLEGEGSEEPRAGAELSAARIQVVLDQCNGMQEEAWRLLGLASRHQLARLIRRHGLSVTRRRGS